MSMQFVLELPLPPTTNQAYFNVPGRGRVLSTAARKFKDKAVLSAAQARREQGWRYEPGARLSLSLEFHFARDGKRDLSNRLKLVEDALAKALGFDDSVIDLIILRRGEKCQREYCEVLLEEYNPRGTRQLAAGHYPAQAQLTM
jgi:Holliday junction resolvase RusA-like endonuclease